MAMSQLIWQFLSKYAPLYERREAIIAGKAEPTDAEVEAGQAADSDDEDDEEEGARISEVTDEKDEDSKVAGIPEFWLTALRNHVAISETITDRDEEVSGKGIHWINHSFQVLKKLENVRLSYPEGDRPGFKLHFTFGKNEFFDDAELTKTYFYQEQVGYGGDFVYDKAIGHDIKWKEDKDLTKKVEIKKQRNKCELDLHLNSRCNADL
jgi:nucleosome assembly protein 1-like 1